MGLRYNKYYFEKKFFDGWTHTLVQYAGQEFKTNGLSQWINPIYRPSSSSSYGLNDRSEVLKGSLDVVCWGKNNTEALHLADLVIEFVRDNIEPDMFKVDKYEIQDMYWDDSGYHYVYVTFAVRSYNLQCVEQYDTNLCISQGTNGVEYGFKSGEFGVVTPKFTIDGLELLALYWDNTGKFTLLLDGVLTKYIYITYKNTRIELELSNDTYFGENAMIANELIYGFTENSDVCFLVESLLPNLFIEYIF